MTRALGTAAYYLILGGILAVPLLILILFDSSQ